MTIHFSVLEVVQMDAQHRHQLQHHDLQDLTLQAVPWFEKYGMTLVISAVAALAILLGGAVWFSSAESTHAAAWNKLSTATTVDEFGAVADAYPGTLAAAWAQLRSAEITQESGIAAMFTDRELALADLKSAKESFEKVLSSPVELPDNVKERAMLGLARCLEATCDGKTEPVIEAYQKLLVQFPESAYKKVAEDKILALKSPSAQQFYSWFHQQAPKPAAFPRPNDGNTGNLPAGNPFELPPPAKPAADDAKPEKSGTSDTSSDSPKGEAATKESPNSASPAPAQPE